jgi:osmotically-inducible protein OsmY
MKTKLALLTTAGVSGMAINVDTVFGRVTLHGTVRSAAEQAKAETIAQHINGVQGVRNLLQVVAAPDEQAVQVADDALTERITQELQADPALHDSRIAVQSVHQGVVLLGGTAQTLSDHLRAVALAASVPGVRRVTGGQVPPWPMRRSGASPRHNSQCDGWHGGSGPRSVDHLGHEDACCDWPDARSTSM